MLNQIKLFNALLNFGNKMEDSFYRLFPSEHFGITHLQLEKQS